MNLSAISRSMKILILTCFLLVVTVSATTLINDVFHNEWNVYKLQFNKSYEEFGDERYRMSVYLKNRKIISDHNAQYHQGKTSYVMAVNQFTDLTNDEFVEQYLSPITPNVSSIPFDDEEWSDDFEWDEDTDDLQAFDWRTRGAVTQVKHQRGCGSCWAFSTTGAIEATNFFKTRRLVSLSEQELVDCDRRNHGCGGGYMPNAFDYVKRNGIHTGNDYRYVAKKQSCKNPRGNKVHIGGFIRVPANENALLRAVKRTPVSVGVDARGFQHYGGRVFDYSACTHNLNHGVLIAGFGVQNRKNYWLVKNSWGAGWGERGYIKMSRNRNNQCGIANLATYAT